MSHGQKASRNLIRSNALWFDLNKYEMLSDASPMIWYQQFASRIDLRRARPLLLNQQEDAFSLIANAHATLTDLIRKSGVLHGEVLKLFMDGEQWLSPETFSAMHAVGVQGLHVGS